MKRADAAGLARLGGMEAWVFDLDNTLYPASSNLFDQIDRRMCLYIAGYLEVTPAQAYGIQKNYFREHGTTLKGMMERHGMDPGPYLDYVHQVDITAIVPNARLDRALGMLPGRKLIFTNASHDHAERILDHLEVARHFEGIFDIIAADYLPKPEIKVYEKLVADYSLNPEATIMIEDVVRNLGPAKDLGMTTVWVETDTPWAVAGLENEQPDFIIADLADWLARVAGG